MVTKTSFRWNFDPIQIFWQNIKHSNEDWCKNKFIPYDKLPEEDKDLLAASSPLLHIDKIKVPLFIAQGTNDPRVKKSESDQIVEALKQVGIEVQYMVKDDEGHGFYNQENAFDFYRAMEKFLLKHIGWWVKKPE